MAAVLAATDLAAAASRAPAAALTKGV